MSRPKTGRKGERTCIYLSKESKDFVIGNGFQANLSQFINGLITSLNDDSPEILRIKVMDAAKRKSHLQQELALAETELDMLQAKLALYKEKGDVQGKARQEVLARWWDSVKRDRVKGETLFRGWLTGPANLHYVKECAFDDEDALIAWCKSQEGRA